MWGVFHVIPKKQYFFLPRKSRQIHSTQGFWFFIFIFDAFRPERLNVNVEIDHVNKCCALPKNKFDHPLSFNVPSHAFLARVGNKFQNWEDDAQNKEWLEIYEDATSEILSQQDRKRPTNLWLLLPRDICFSHCQLSIDWENLYIWNFVDQPFSKWKIDQELVRSDCLNCLEQSFHTLG